MNSCQKLVPGCISPGRWPPSVRLLVTQQCDPAEDPFRFNTVCIRNLSADVGPIEELCHFTSQESNMEIDLTSWSSIPMDGLISPAWAPEKMLGKGLWEGPSDDDGVEETVMGSSSTPPDTPYYSSGNPYLQVASWPQQALKASESSSEQSAVLVETNWAPSGNHSGSCAQSSESGLSEGLPALLDVPAAEPAAAPGPRVVLRSRARRNQGSEPPATQAMAVDQPAAQQAQQQPDVQTLEPTSRAQQRPDWAFHKGRLMCGDLKPFESIKGFSLETSCTLQDINARLKAQHRQACQRFA